MGFWHTGYAEFHERHWSFEPRHDADTRPILPPPVFRCSHCQRTYASVNELREHRFECQPLHRPTLFLDGRELGTHPVRVTRALGQDDVSAHGGDRARLNGREIPVQAIPHELASIASGVCLLELARTDVVVKFTLEFCIAAEDDLKGVERQFETMARKGQLDIRAIESFICATADFDSAIGYCDGICSYLYGVLAKEGASDSSLPYERYVAKFNDAADRLVDYQRPLSRTIGSLIEFHFNHFSEAMRLGRNARVGQAAARYENWLRCDTARPANGLGSTAALHRVEELATDLGTEQIIRWAIRPLDYLREHVDEMEKFLERYPEEEYDSIKVHLLLGETYAKCGDMGKAIQHAKSVRNRPQLERWGDSIIRTHSKDQDEQP